MDAWVAGVAPTWRSMGAIVAMRGRTTKGIRRPIGGVGQCANKFAPTALMVAPNYSVDPDIAVASTIDSAFYRDEAAYALARERIFARSWQWIGDLADVAEPGTLAPRELLAAACSTSRCCSRATTRARCAACPTCARIAATSWSRPRMPGRPDPLRLSLAALRSLRAHDVHAGIRGGEEFSRRRPTTCRRFPSARGPDTASPRSIPRRRSTHFCGDLRSAPRPGCRSSASVSTRRVSRDYVVDAHWALYVENYLEELHIPFVHPASEPGSSTAQRTSTSCSAIRACSSRWRRKARSPSILRPARPITADASPRTTGGSFPT